MTFNKDIYLNTFSNNDKTHYYYDIASLVKKYGKSISEYPYSIRILLEQALRQYDGINVTQAHLEDLIDWHNKQEISEYPFKPMRVLLQDFTGVPAIVDLASMRDAMQKLNEDPSKINPDIKVDLVVDHSVQVDVFGRFDAPKINRELEFERNEERYKFIKWAQNAFDNFSVVPADTGICHQVNIEYLADVISISPDGKNIAYPDTCFGTDSHTPMVNGLGVLGWGVGGIEAEAAMLGQFSYAPLPSVVGVELVGELSEWITTTDLVLTITNVLREHHVVGQFVEFYGDGYQKLNVSDRATLGNMTPEFGSTVSLSPIDDETLDYLTLTNRSEEQVQLVENYAKANHLWYQKDDKIQYSRTITIDMGQVESIISGPKRPQDKITLSEAKTAFQNALIHESGNFGFGLEKEQVKKSVQTTFQGEEITLNHGSLFIAAITSCTNTSNPHVMMAAGLLARNAVKLGMQVPIFVKTSLAPGSKTVTKYYQSSGLSKYLDQLGFNVVGYGCTTCIGNSGPLHADLIKIIQDNKLISAAVLSGNRNFEGRINPHTFANYLASPPLVIAFALAGRINIDLTSEPIGVNKEGQEIYLKDIWPNKAEIDEFVNLYVKREIYQDTYQELYEDNPLWQSLDVPLEEVYQWQDDSTYVQNPPYFEEMSLELDGREKLSNLRVLAKLGDSVTTDHISPAGSIAAFSPAGEYLKENGLGFKDYNSYGSRRGNHQVMIRGTLANPRIDNQIAQGQIGGYTTYWPTNEVRTIYEAAMDYRQSDTGLVILAGSDYGMGSSRDWAAKGVKLLNVKAVIAKSYERIHRANLVMMGILPLEFLDGQDAESLNLTGEEIFDIPVDENTGIHDIIKITARRQDVTITFNAKVRFDSLSDIQYYLHDGILPNVIREKAKQS